MNWIKIIKFNDLFYIKLRVQTLGAQLIKVITPEAHYKEWQVQFLIKGYIKRIRQAAVVHQ